MYFTVCSEALWTTSKQCISRDFNLNFFIYNIIYIYFFLMRFFFSFVYSIYRKSIERFVSDLFKWFKNIPYTFLSLFSPSEIFDLILSKVLFVSPISSRVIWNVIAIWKTHKKPTNHIKRNKICKSLRDIWIRLFLFPVWWN